MLTVGICEMMVGDAGRRLLTGTAGDDDKTLVVVTVAAYGLLRAGERKQGIRFISRVHREQVLTSCCC